MACRIVIVIFYLSFLLICQNVKLINKHYESAIGNSVMYFDRSQGS